MLDEGTNTSIAESIHHSVFIAPTWYPKYDALSKSMGDELKAHLSTSRLNEYYAAMDWNVVPDDNVKEFFVKADIIQKASRRYEDTIIKFYPSDRENPLYISMAVTAQCLNLSLEGSYFGSQVAPTDADLEMQKYFSLTAMMKKRYGQEQSTYYFLVRTAKTEALKIVGRFTLNAVFLRKLSSTKMSLRCMKHLAHSLRGEPVAWGKVLWEHLVKAVRMAQSRPYYIKGSSHLAVVVAVLLLRLKNPTEVNPDQNLLVNTFKNAKATQQNGSLERESPCDSLRRHKKEMIEHGSDFEDELDWDETAIQCDDECDLSLSLSRIESSSRGLNDFQNNQQNITRYGVETYRRRREVTYPNSNIDVVEPQVIKRPRHNHVDGETILEEHKGKNFAGDLEVEQLNVPNVSLTITDAMMNIDSLPKQTQPDFIFDREPGNRSNMKSKAIDKVIAIPMLEEFETYMETRTAEYLSCRFDHSALVTLLESLKAKTIKVEIYNGSVETLSSEFDSAVLKLLGTYFALENRLEKIEAKDKDLEKQIEDSVLHLTSVGRRFGKMSLLEGVKAIINCWIDGKKKNDILTEEEKNLKTLERSGSGTSDQIDKINEWLREKDVEIQNLGRQVNLEQQSLAEKETEIASLRTHVEEKDQQLKSMAETADTRVEDLGTGERRLSYVQLVKYMAYQ